LAVSSKRSIRTSGIVVLIVLAFCIPLFFKNPYWLQVFGFAFMNVILASSLRTIYLTGELSLGHAGFMLIGAYTSALLSMRVGLPVWLTMWLGGLLAAAVALILGYPILKTKGVYFSVLTLIVAEVIRLTMFFLPNLSGGGFCLPGVPPPEAINILGITITFDTPGTYYYIFLVVALLSLVILYLVERALDITLRAIRQSDSLAESVGINVMGYKLLAFVIGCFFAGIAGALFGHFILSLTVDITGKFAMLTSIYVVIYLMVGGSAKFAGPIIGAIVLTLLPEVARPLKEFQPIAFGGIVILCIFFMRQGLIALPYYLSLWWGKALGHLRKTPLGEG
jgi:branched-chain amino acid transport system permease protein